MEGLSPLRKSGKDSVFSKKKEFAQEGKAKRFLKIHDSLIPSNKWIDSLQLFLALPSTQSLQKEIDSLTNDKVATLKRRLFLNVDSLKLPLPANQFPSKKDYTDIKKGFQFNGGMLHYEWNFRSAVDTPFSEYNVSQHLLTGRMQFAIAEKIPLQFTYFERQSNSHYFRDYRNIRLEFNAQEYQRIRARKFQNTLTSFTNQLRDPSLKSALDCSKMHINNFSQVLKQQHIVKDLIEARLLLIDAETIDTTHFEDSSVLKAKALVHLYERLLNATHRLEGYRDSLQLSFIEKEKQLASLKKVLTGNVSPFQKERIVNELQQYDNILSKRVVKIISSLSSIRTLAVGRVLPNHSDLTLKNINLNGVNFEYNRRFYFAFSAGAIDYRVREFFTNTSRQKRSPQLVYAARIGYGDKENSHIYLSAFSGHRQVLSTAQRILSRRIYGMSLEGQIQLNTNTFLKGEMAQSHTSELADPVIEKRSSFKLADPNNKAYSLNLKSYLPKTRTRFDGYYQHRGINYESFSTYYTNASTSRWHVKLSQLFWKKRISFTGALAKNTFDNPYLLTRFNGKTVYKNLSFTYRQPKKPSLSFGYMPSSQLSIIDSFTYESFFQIFNATAAHSYAVGTARANTTLTYNRFYNDSRDSGFIYYNATNFYAAQQFQFLRYEANINVSKIKNKQYTLNVLEGGGATTICKKQVIGFGIKLNQLNTDVLKVGLYGNSRLVLSKLGELNVRIEKAYLPDVLGGLYKTEFYTIGFMRFFK